MTKSFSVPLKLKVKVPVLPTFQGSSLPVLRVPNLPTFPPFRDSSSFKENSKKLLIGK